MKFVEAIRLALLQIRVQKLKSFFTVLGVTIGVMFLIAVVSIVAGMSRYMEEDFVGKLMGINSFELRRFPSINIGNTTDEQWREWERRPFIKDSDLRPITEALPSGTLWSATNFAQDISVEAPYARPRKIMMFAVDGDYFKIKRIELAEGRALAPQELSHGSLSIVLGDEVARHFFRGRNPIGRGIKLGDLRYRVVGVAEKQGSIFGISLDKFVIVPRNSPARRLTQRAGIIGTLTVQGSTRTQMNEAMEQVRQIMRGRHKLRPSQPDDFDMSTSESALEFWDKIRSYMELAGVALPAIGLVVGGIVIMNIMLVAVASRTKEIGIRKALGARRRDILRQFLSESATLSIIGAAIGIALGIALAETIAATTALPASVVPWSIAVGLLIGAGVGILAGIYPATRASRLDPILAMRQE